MRKLYTLLAALMLTTAAGAQTLKINTSSNSYSFSASDVTESSPATFTNGTTLTVNGTSIAISDITSASVEESSSSSSSSATVNVVYSGSSATVTASSDISSYVTITQSGAHVSIVQSSSLATEITYNLSGSSSDGEFYMEGSYKATLVLNGLTLTNSTPVYSGAAIHIQNSKRIDIKLTEGTTSTLTDASSGSQKGCLYVKGHAEFKQKGTLNVVGNKKHGIKTGEYLTIKNATINVTSSVGDGINCEQYFLMESGTVSLSGVGDDGIQCDIEGDSSTGETTDHESEDSGNIYISGGTIGITATATAAKGIKGEGDMTISDGTITIKTTGSGEWDSDDSETKAASCISGDGNITISGGTLTLTSTGSGGKGMKCDGTLTISGGTINATTSGGLYYNNGSTENTNYTSDTDNVSSSYYSSPKAIKAGLKTQSGSSYTYSGGINITGGTVTATTSGHNGEGIESKNTLEISGSAHITVEAYDDGINSAQDLTINGGYVYSRASNNDGIDANGNCYIKSGVVFAVGSSSPEVAIDANSEDKKQLYFSGGTLVAIGGLESGASLTQSCYSSSSWSKSTWYALYNGDDLALAFKTPSSGGTTLVVSTSGTTSLKSGVTVSGGTTYFGGVGNIGGTVSGGSSVSLSSYSASSGGGGGGNPGGGGPGGGR